MSLIFLAERLQLLTLLKDYLKENNEELQLVYTRAHQANSWFTTDNIELAVNNIVESLLDENALQEWVAHYQIPAQSESSKSIGIIMAGNIPLVGFHDVLCTFVAGHQAQIKLSSKDKVLWQHIISWLYAQHNEAQQYFQIKEQIPNCDAYIATGSNNTSRYFESFFEKYPHIIRKNRSSVAVITEEDSLDDLIKDTSTFFGLGCRNVSLVYLPEGYDLDKILMAYDKIDVLKHHHSYHNNFDYHLAIYLLNRVPIKYNESIILVENELSHAPLSVLHYTFYTESQKSSLIEKLLNDDTIQCIATNVNAETSDKIVPLGGTQKPSLYQYPDGEDVMAFLLRL